MLTANRGLCGGYNGNVLRAGLHRWRELQSEVPERRAGSRRQARHRGLQVPRDHAADQTYTHFEDKPTFDEVDVLANRYLDEYVTGKLDRLDVVYTKFESIARQQVAVVETLLPLGSLDRRRREPSDEAAQAIAVRVPAVGREHSGRGRAGELQGASSSSASSTRRSASRSPAWWP